MKGDQVLKGGQVLKEGRVVKRDRVLNEGQVLKLEPCQEQWTGVLCCGSVRDS